MFLPTATVIFPMCVYTTLLYRLYRLIYFLWLGCSFTNNASGVSTPSPFNIVAPMYPFLATPSCPEISGCPSSFVLIHTTILLTVTPGLNKILFF